MEINKNFICMLTAIVVSGCASSLDNDSVEYGDYQLYDYYVDSYGNVGVVALKDDNRIVVISGDEGEASWGPENILVCPFGESANIWYAYNDLYPLSVNQLVEQLGASAFPAFDWCIRKNKDTRQIHTSSWILPSHAILEDMLYYGDSDKLDNALKSLGLTPLADNPRELYWSATEDIESLMTFDREDLLANYDFDPVSRAIPVTRRGLFNTDKSLWLKEQPHRIRAVKYIYYNYPIEKD